MDLICNNALISNEYSNFIVRFRREEQDVRYFESDCIRHIGDLWLVTSVYNQNFFSYSYGTAGYYRIPKLYATTDLTSMEASGVIRLQNNPVLDYTGKNVLVGLVDTGINYAHPVFLDAAGKTRLRAIWDQNGEGVVNENVAFGREYTTKDINEALAAENPYELVPGDLEDSHGTFLAGIAAGSAIGSDFTGVAPQAAIAMVKLRPAKKQLRDFYLIREGARAYSEVDIMLGVQYLVELSTRLSMPLVLLVGLGTTYGPHTGDMPLAQYLSQIADRYETVVVTPTGNEGNGRRHYFGTMSSMETQSVEINVGSGERGFMLELWAENPDVYTLEFISPSGEVVPRVPAGLGRSNVFEFVFERTKLRVDYQLVENLSGNFLVTVRFEEPTEGIWRINIYGSQVLNGRYNMWLPMGEFLSGDTYFISSNPDITITAPGTSEETLTVSAYNHYTNSIYINSGRGYLANGMVKPDIAAPGVNVYGPTGRNGFAQRSGTSISAAHTAGCAALLLEWGVNNNNFKYMDTAVVKNLMIKGAVRDKNKVYPNNEWGYGRLNIYQVFESLKTQ